MEQRRAVVEGLIADRENARYTDLAARYRSGQSSLPPPPAPPELSAAIAAAAAALVPAQPTLVRPDAAADATQGDPPKAEVDDGSFSDFLSGLVRDTSPKPTTTEETPEPQTNLAPSAALQNLAAEAEASTNGTTAAAEPAAPAVVPGGFRRAELLALGRLLRLARATDATAVAAPIAAAAPVSGLEQQDGFEWPPLPSPRRPSDRPSDA